ncbi:hypothetical protein CVM52_08845 [Pseudooceanicola lipolyticus]|uniref:Luciferase-like domain-containing protein n=1 Tax=Pseudooceanicola lipolyticus TaxID=2029104 RepID=A0A2M8J2Q8_9RHOB|nr:hypothetical protein [Pseudooceanicola lipolyticus]PJE37053.1 hypothetical protein CVM52_08845 [Pseudooceanicola lipolyticus]
MKLGYLSIPPACAQHQGPNGFFAAPRANLAEALGFTEFYALPPGAGGGGVEPGGPERQALLRILPDRPGRVLPELVAVDGNPRRQNGRTAGALVAPAIGASTVRAQSRQGHAPLSVSWLDADLLARHWAAHVTGSTHAARCARRRDWRVARTVVVDDDPLRAEATVKGPDSPCRAYYRNALPPGASDAAVAALIDACVLYGSQASVMAQLEALAQTAAFGTLVFVDHPWPDAALARRSMTLFADAVLQLHQTPTTFKIKKLELA